MGDPNKKIKKKRNDLVRKLRIHFFYNQLGSGLSRKSCLYFQGFRGSKLLNGCLVVTDVYEQHNNFQDSKSILSVILNFPSNAFETADVWYFVGLTAILHLLQKKNFFFSL